MLVARSSWKAQFWAGLASAGLLGCARPAPTRASNVAEAFAEFQRVWRVPKTAAAGCRISGRILDADHGKPLAHALVSASTPRAWNSAQAARDTQAPLAISDEAGQWSLDLQEARAYELLVSASDFLPESRRLLDCSSKVENFSLQRGGATIFGSARALDGTPLAGATICAHGFASEAPLGRVVARGLTDKNGRYSVTCPAGDYVIEARYPRAVTARVPVTLARIGFANFRLPHAGSISGRVRSRATGEPTPNVVVSATEDATGTSTGSAMPSTVSDGSGAFTLAGLWPGPVTLSAHAEGLTTYAATALSVGSNEEKQDIELWLDSASSRAETIIRNDSGKGSLETDHAPAALGEGQTIAVQGRVVDARLEPIPDVWLEVSSSMTDASRALDSAVHRVQVGESGDFEVAGLRPGPYRVDLYDEYGRRPWANSATADVEAAPARLLVRAARNPALQLTAAVCASSMRGRALNTRGLGVPDAWVYAHREGDEVDSAFSRSPSLATSADGSFELRRLCPGKYHVSITSSDRSASAARGGLTANDQPVLTLLGLSTVSGVVSYDKAPVTDYVIDFAGPRAQRITVRAPDGKYRLAQLESGMYEVLVSAEHGYALGMLEVLAGSAVEHDFELRAWKSLSARVVDGGGRALAGVDVQVVFEPPAGETADLLGPNVRVRRAATDDRGRFELERVSDERGYIALSRAGSALLIEGVGYASQFGMLSGPHPRLDFELSRGRGQDLGLVRVRAANLARPDHVE